MLSWLLVGSLNHYALNPRQYSNQNAMSNAAQAQPIPQEASCHIADHIQVNYIHVDTQNFIITFNKFSI